MKVAVMQPYLFPYISYYQLVNAVDKFIIFDDVNYINKGWINRNRILVNHQEHLFTVPLLGASQNKLIKDIEIDAGDKWRAKLLQTIEQSYRKAPFFTDVLPLLKDILVNSNANLSSFILNSISVICAYLDIPSQIITSSAQYQNENLKGEDRIIDICLKEDATVYVNAIGGAELYSKDKFAQNKLELLFIKSKPIEYAQLGKPFIPWLSIIDVMMFCHPEEIKGFLQNFELV